MTALAPGEHIPGPWERRWTHTSDGERTEQTGRIVSERFGTVCHLVMDDHVDATARLIASAPDMAEALALVVRGLDFGPDANPLEVATVRSRAEKAAREALKKAGVTR